MSGDNRSAEIDVIRRAAFYEGFAHGANVVADSIATHAVPDLLAACDKAWSGSISSAMPKLEAACNKALNAKLHDVETCGIEGCERCASYYDLIAETRSDA